MRKFLLTISRRCELASSIAGSFAAGLGLLLVLVTVYDVCLRYFFHAGSVAVQEAEWHLFGLMFLLGAGFTLKNEGHVRVDLFYSRWSKKTKAWINIAGSVLFLFPFCAIVIWSSLPFIGRSLQFWEGSADPGGLGMRFLIKSAIPVGFLFLAMQGVAFLINNILVLIAGGDQDVALAEANHSEAGL